MVGLKATMNTHKLYKAIEILYKIAANMEKKSMWAGEPMISCSKCGKEPVPEKYYPDGNYLCYECQQKEVNKPTSSSGGDTKEKVLKLFEEALVNGENCIKGHNRQYDSSLKIYAMFTDAAPDVQFWSLLHSPDVPGKTKKLLEIIENFCEKLDVVITADPMIIGSEKYLEKLKNKYDKYFDNASARDSGIKLDFVDFVVPINDDIIFDIIENFTDSPWSETI